MCVHTSKAYILVCTCTYLHLIGYLSFSFFLYHSHCFLHVLFVNQNNVFSLLCFFWLVYLASLSDHICRQCPKTKPDICYIHIHIRVSCKITHTGWSTYKLCLCIWFSAFVCRHQSLEGDFGVRQNSLCAGTAVHTLPGARDLYTLATYAAMRTNRSGVLVAYWIRCTVHRLLIKRILLTWAFSCRFLAIKARINSVLLTE